MIVSLNLRHGKSNLSAHKIGLASTAHAKAGVKDEAPGYDGFPVVRATLVAHTGWDVGGEEPPFVANAVGLGSFQKELMLLLSPISLRLPARISPLTLPCQGIQDNMSIASWSETTIEDCCSPHSVQATEGTRLQIRLSCLFQRE